MTKAFLALRTQLGTKRQWIPLEFDAKVIPVVYEKTKTNINKIC